MIKKDKEKTRAISLRKKGLSYNEILREVPVAKSTLSVWLKNIGIAKPQKQKLAQQKAQEACRQSRISRETLLVGAAKQEIGKISKRELWLIGIILYWAEGSKQKAHNVSQRVSFGNSDPDMIKLFIRWAKEINRCKSDDFVYSLYIHETSNTKRARIFWEKTVNGKISWTYLKKHNPKSRRRNTQDNYHGLLRVDIRRSTDLNRIIRGWSQGIFENFKI